MTNDELKKKIVEIIRYCYVNEKDYGYIFDLHIEEKINAIADALIAAGLTFEPIIIRTVELPDECEKKIHDILKEEEAIIEEVAHRAEVAERALHNCCFNMIYAPFGVVVRPTVDELYKAHLERSKKELQEERKDEKLE